MLLLLLTSKFQDQGTNISWESSQLHINIFIYASVISNS